MATGQCKWEESSSKNKNLHCLNITIPIHLWIFHFHSSEHSPPFLHRLCCLFLSIQLYESALVCTKWIGRFVCTVWGHRATQTTLHGCPDQVMTYHPNNFYITLRYSWWFYIYHSRVEMQSQTSYHPHTNKVKTLYLHDDSLLATAFWQLSVNQHLMHLRWALLIL